MAKEKKAKKIEVTDNEELDQDKVAEDQEAGTEKKSETGKKAKSKKRKSDSDNKQEKIDELESNLAGLNDKYLRLFSEFDNYRKRTIKERVELIKNASEDVITELLPVLDDFERAFKSMEADKVTEKTIEGFKLIYNKFRNTLVRKGLEEIKAIGEDFDTDFHEAITNIPAPSEDLKGKVVDEIEKGYLLNDKVIRFAKVVVGQ